ncbi:MAG: DUF488 family protein [Alphaproteobacteria bacterium]|nr:DUF488 family protein [Alphaproteobacteria bacterium]MCL2889723.1 DUF488 family protein [Alphaproteobacteria bacterium]
MLQIKRIYDAPAKTDGYRILVDQLWPRGISKEHAHLDKWAKEITPSSELRTEFHNGQYTFPGFSHAYIVELSNNPSMEQFIAEIRNRLAHGNVTLLYAAHDATANHAIVLKNYIDKKLQI